MAVGNNTTLTNTAAVNSQLASDATNIQQFIYWAQKKYAEYNHNLATIAQQSAAGITVAGDQALVSGFIGDLNRIQTWLTGGTGIALGQNILQDMSDFTGIQ